MAELRCVEERKVARAFTGCLPQLTGRWQAIVMLGRNPGPDGARLDLGGQMSGHRRLRKKCTQLLVSAAVVVGSSFAGPMVAGANAQRVASAGHNDGNPRAVPPILAPATPSELLVIRHGEAEEAAAIAYQPPGSAQYSLAGLNGYATANK